MLTTQNHLAVLAEAKYRSKIEVERIVARLDPKPDVPSTIRKLPPPTPAGPPGPAPAEPVPMAKQPEQTEAPAPGPNTDAVASLPPAPAAIYNIGNNAPVELDRLIAALEASLGRQAIRRNCGMQPGDMLTTYADIEPLHDAVRFSPATSIEEGVARFVAWYLNYHGVARSE